MTARSVIQHVLTEYYGADTSPEYDPAPIVARVIDNYRAEVGRETRAEVLRGAADLLRQMQREEPNHQAAAALYGAEKSFRSMADRTERGDR